MSFFLILVEEKQEMSQITATFSQFISDISQILVNSTTLVFQVFRTNSEKVRGSNLVSSSNPHRFSLIDLRNAHSFQDITRNS